MTKKPTDVPTTPAQIRALLERHQADPTTRAVVGVLLLVVDRLTDQTNALDRNLDVLLKQSQIIGTLLAQLAEREA